MANIYINLIFLFLLISAFCTYGFIAASNDSERRKKTNQPLPKFQMRIVALLKFLAMAPVVAAGIILATGNSSPYGWLIAIGLAICLVADMAIMKNFVAGLAVFLVGHIVYIAAFSLDNLSLDLSSLWVLPYLAIGVVVYIILWPKLNIMMKIAVAVYVAAISIMSWRALDQLVSFGSPLALLAVAGAILFMTSDTALALKTFQPNHLISDKLNLRKNGEALIMSTYIVAQWLICLSIAK